MNRFRIALLLLLTALLLLTVPAWAEEAEDLTGSCTVKVVDKTGLRIQPPLMVIGLLGGGMPLSM